MAPPPKSVSGSAFSLVEVVIAIGVIAVAIIPLIGLVNVGLKANKVSAEELGALTIASSVWTDLYAQTSNGTAPVSNRYGLGMPLLQANSISDTRYFYADGTMISGTTTAAIAAARAQSFEMIYRVALNYTPCGKYLTPASNQPALVSLTVSWPALGGTNSQKDSSWQGVKTFAQAQAQATPSP